MHNKLRTLIESKAYDNLSFFISLLYASCIIPFTYLDSEFKNALIFGILPIILLNFSTFRRSVIFKLLIIALAIQLVSWLYSFHTIPEFAISHPEMQRLTSLFTFIFISIALKGQPKRINTILLVTALSFVLTILYVSFHTHELIKGLSGYRVDFGMHNAQYTGMISAVSIFISVYLLANVKPLKKHYQAILYLTISLVLSISFIVLLITQTRQVWLGFIVVLFFSPIIVAYIFKFNKKLVATIYLSIFISISLLFSTNLDFVKKRVLSESQVIENIASGEFDNIPMTSIGIRVNSWLLSIEWIKSSPVIGSSTTAIPLVLRTSEKFNRPELKRYGHLHNYFIETLVAYGAIGLLFIVIYFLHISKSILNSSDNKEKTLFIAFIIFWLIINNFESYSSKDLGLFIQTVIFGALYSKYITTFIQREESHVE